jgi:Ni,Fe-hydrogenase I cytochrome b subunit
MLRKHMIIKCKRSYYLSVRFDFLYKLQYLQISRLNYRSLQRQTVKTKRAHKHRVVVGSINLTLPIDGLIASVRIKLLITERHMIKISQSGIVQISMMTYLTLQLLVNIGLVYTYIDRLHRVGKKTSERPRRIYC